MKVFVTGAAGFIGYHVCQRLASTKRCEVLGVDSLTDYYDVALKRARLAQLEPLEEFRFVQLDIAEGAKLAGLMAHFKPDYVVHLAAQAGVRHSFTQPGAYVQANLVGFANLLEACRSLPRPPRHVVFASSSSVYGASREVPFREDGPTDQPVSFYGATKKANELMAHAYAHGHGLMLTGLRFFTVYGPWGRPDMAPVLFSKAILAGEPVRLFNHGKNRRDFTYIDDVVDAVVKVLLYPLAERPTPPYRIFNVGHHRPVETTLFVQMLESLLGRKAQVELLPAQMGDLPETCADLTRLQAAIGYAPKVPLEEGLRQFVAWYRDYYGAGLEGAAPVESSREAR